MGYSEVHCQLCGVSFNISRIRTKGEARINAWKGTTKYRGASFLGVTEESYHRTCLPSSGCSVVYREDSRRWHYRRREDKEAEETNKLLALDDDDPSATYVQNKEDENSTVNDNMSFDYEHDEPPEECSDVDMEDAVETDEMTSEAEYRDFAESITRPQQVMRELSPYATSYCGSTSCPGLHTPVGDDYYMTAGSLCTRPEDEILLPLYKDATVDPKDASRISKADRDHLEANYSHRAHPLSVTSDTSSMRKYSIDGLWEHIAGPKCVHTGAYTVNSISLEEMRGCTTAQALCLKSETEQTLEATDDEPWERNGKLFLSGIGDNSQSRDWGWLNVHPARRDRQEVHAEEYLWAHDPDAVNEYAMAFHPTCLEVFKRASILRAGSWSAERLDAWWRDQDDRGRGHDIPRHPAVQAGSHQSWHHGQDDAWLAANPLFIPALDEAVARSIAAESCNSEVSHQQSLLTSLPSEIMREIFDYLEVAEVSAAAVALPSLKEVARPYLKDRVMKESPYLWEIWCDLPYARWTGTTEAELKAAQYAFDRNEKEINFVLDVLKEEGEEDAYTACEAYWSSDRDQRFRDMRGPAWDEKDAIVLDSDRVDLAYFLYELDLASKQGKLKGLRNRERIWKDCNYILDLIEQREQ